jgi:hypothetical protein
MIDVISGEHGLSLGGATRRVHKITMKKTGNQANAAYRMRLTPLAPNAKHSKAPISIVAITKNRP